MLESTRIKTEIPGPKSRALMERRHNAVSSGVGIATPMFAREAKGALLTDVDGNTFIDFGGGIGVIEIGARFDRLTFESAGTAGEAFTNPRSDHLVPNTDSTITFGVNWMPIRWVKIVGNALRQSFDDVNRAPINGVADYWSGLLRLQVAF